MNTIKINIGTGEFGYSRQAFFTQKEIDIESLSESDLIRFLNKTIEEVCKDKILWELYTLLNSRVLQLKDKELNFLYATTGSACSASHGVGVRVLLKEMARRFYNRSQKAEHLKEP